MRNTIVLIASICVALTASADLFAQDHLNVELVGRVGTTWEDSYDVAVSGNYAYLATAYCGLQVLDISDPENSESVGSFEEYPSKVRAVFIRDDYAYLAIDENGLVILDVSDPADPQEVGSCDLEETADIAYDVFVSGAYAYMTEKGSEGDFLSVIDVSDPQNPDKICAYEIGEVAMGVFVSENYAFVADSSEGLRIIDVSDPDDLNEVSVFDTPGAAYSVCIMGEHAYLAIGGYGLLVIDVSDPENPREISVCNTPRSAMNVFVAGEYAYVADSPGGLCVIDLSDLEDPRRAGQYYSDRFGYARGIFVSGDVTYVAANGLHVVDVSDPSHPNEVDVFGISGYSSDVFVVEDYAYVVNYVSNGDGGLIILDVSNPETPQRISVLDLDGIDNRPFFKVFVQDDLAYLVSSPVICIIDVSDPENPAEVGTYEFENNRASDIFVLGNYIYVANGWQRFCVIDVSDPRNPEEVGLCEIEDYSFICVFVSGEYAYVNYGVIDLVARDDDDFSYWPYLGVIDISDPTDPQLLGTCEAGPFCSDAYDNLCISGEYAYISTYDNFYTIDVSDPEHPEVVAEITGGLATGVSISGDYAFMSELNHGLLARDISNPEDVGDVGYYDTRGNARGVFATEEFVYIADYSNVGIYRLQIEEQVIDVSANHLDYGVITVGREAESILNIRNLGARDLTISSIDVTENWCRVDFEGPIILQPGGNHEITASFTPEEEGRYGVDSLTITSNSPIYEEFIIELKGKGMRGHHFEIPEGYTGDVFVSGNYAYVANSYDELHVIDISNPENLSEVGSCSLFTSWGEWDIFVLDDYAYAVDCELYVIDVSNPENPTVVCDYDTPGEALGVFVLGDYAYIADNDTGLCVIDISNPENPSEVDTCETPEDARGIFVLGDYAYVTCGSRGLGVINISNPANTHLVGVCEISANEIFVQGDYAYVTGGDFHVIDISNPESPREVGVYDAWGYSYDVYVSGNYAYITRGYCLSVMDISDPTMPAEVESFWTPGHSDGVFVSEGFAYVADGDLEVFQYEMEGSFLSTSPIKLDFGIVPINKSVGKTLTIRNLGIDDLLITGISTQDANFRVDFNGEILLEPYARSEVTVTIEPNEDGRCHGILVLESNDPHNNAREVRLSGEGIRGYHIDTPGSARDVFISGSYAYVADGSEGLGVIDVSDPENPVEVGAHDTPGHSGNVFVLDDYAYVADGYSGLRVIDVSNPENPNEVGAYDTPGYARGVFVLGDYAYVADWGSGLRMIDISDPENPNEVGACDMPGYTYDIFVMDNYAYVAHGGLSIVDISNPRELELIATLDTPEYAYDVFVEDNIAYVADGNHSFQAIDVSNPENPELVDSYWTPGRALSVYVSGIFAYVAIEDDGLVILGISDEWGVDPEAGITIPTEFYLSPAYPNPFNAMTVITYGLPVASHVSLQIFDLTGRRVSTLINGNLQPGIHRVNMVANNLPSGLYFVRLGTSRQVLYREVMLLK